MSLSRLLPAGGFVRAASVLFFTASIALAAPAFNFPPGVDWSNATPEQVREVVFQAVEGDPSNAVAIVQAAMEMVQNTGRYPNEGATDGKATVDPDDGVVSLPEIAEQIAQGAIQANPALAPQIRQAITTALNNAPVTPPGTGGTTDGGGTPGGGNPPLPGGFGGGGGSGGGPQYGN